MGVIVMDGGSLPGTGHNSGLVDVITPAAAGQLRSIVGRVERLEVEKADVADAIKEVYAEAKGNGFDVKTLRSIVRLRRQDLTKRREEAALRDLYFTALGEAGE